MKAVSIDIKDILESTSDLGLVFETNLFVSRMPVNPKKCVVVYDSPVGEIDLTMNGKDEQYHRNGMQVRVRDTSYENGMSLAYTIVNHLHGMHNDVWNDTYYALIRCSTPPSVLEWDASNCVHIIANFEIQRRPIAEVESESI